MRLFKVEIRSKAKQMTWKEFQCILWLGLDKSWYQVNNANILIWVRSAHCIRFFVLKRNLQNGPHSWAPAEPQGLNACFCLGCINLPYALTPPAGGIFFFPWMLWVVGGPLASSATMQDCWSWNVCDYIIEWPMDGALKRTSFVGPFIWRGGTMLDWELRGK